ncbi:MAG: nucleotidyl transferase AbiEii/AbiGii toxin family protein [Planctomycetes bacterium]|nr:nucleotidyl transferase AbiEii/AbiGii toxin family protein [Planctomycetota bacterium]
MEIYRDFKELLELFNSQKVEYLVVGGYALAHHGIPRFTRDLDVYVRPNRDNAKRIIAALKAFGFGQVDLKPEDFEKSNQIIQLGYPPVRIDLITSIQGVSWEQADAGKSQGEYGGTSVPFLGRTEFIANKRAAGRAQDRADIEKLEGPSPDNPAH